MAALIDFVSSTASGAVNASAIAEASACLERFTNAFNACSTPRMDDELHFPHILLSGAERLVWERAGQHPSDFFSTLRSTGWHSTRYEAKEPVLASAEKVHFVVTYTRRDEKNTILSTHRNLWIVTRVTSKWGISLRSY